VNIELNVAGIHFSSVWLSQILCCMQSVEAFVLPYSDTQNARKDSVLIS